jgi:hypothetical protein
MTMLVYPQLASGALSQFPVQKRRRRRTVVNTAADGTSVKLADAAAEETEWQLQYSELSDAELGVLRQFFANTEGSLNSFTFLDPTGNLFATSDQLGEAAWQKAPLLTAGGTIADPLGGTDAWLLSNTGAGPQSLCQTLQAPAGYIYCFSVYARATQATTVTLLRGTDRADRLLSSDWKRISFAGSGDPTAASITFGLEVPAGGAVEVFGLQVEPQAGASSYQVSTTGGVYPQARFRDDELSFTSTDVNQNSTTVHIIHASHL